MAQHAQDGLGSAPKGARIPSDARDDEEAQRRTKVSRSGKMTTLSKKEAKRMDELEASLRG